jgi:hypothetical protein
MSSLLHFLQLLLVAPVRLCSQTLAPPHCLHLLIVVVLTEARPPALLARADWRLCSLMLDPSHCLHLLLMRLHLQMPDPPHTPFLAAAHHLDLSPDDPYPVLLSRQQDRLRASPSRLIFLFLISSFDRTVAQASASFLAVPLTAVVGAALIAH